MAAVTAASEPSKAMGPEGVRVTVSAPRRKRQGTGWPVAEERIVTARWRAAIEHRIVSAIPFEKNVCSTG
jgi:hypothetical protein